MTITVAEIAELVGGRVDGEGGSPVTGINGIRQAEQGDLTFLADPRYEIHLKSTGASAVLVPREFDPGKRPAGVAFIHVDAPHEAFLRLLPRFRPAAAFPPSGIHPTAVVGAGAVLEEGVALGAHVCIGEGAQIGRNTVIYAGSYVGNGSRLGEDCLLYPNVTVREEVTIGARCILHSGAVIGADGFGYVFRDGRHVKIPQVGRVVLGDDVEVGANSAIDRAAFGTTAIGSGTKIDNLVQIGHNVEMGVHCIVCGNAGIAGSAILGNYVTIAAGAGVGGHIELGDQATVAAYSGVSKSVKPGQVMLGYPAVELNRGRRMYASLRHLPETQRRVRELEQRIQELEERLNGTSTNDS